MPSSVSRGFSLAELLISLAIIGILATFTVPALLNAQNSTLNSKQSAMAKDVGFMVMNAYDQYRQANSGATASTKLDDLTPYMNYVSIDTTSTLDDRPGANASYDCSVTATYTCLKLHNGGTLYWKKAHTFTGTDTQYAIYFLFDPDSVLGGTGTADGPGKALNMFLYYDGHIRDWTNLLSSTVYNNGLSTGSANSSRDPAWFSGF